MKLGITFEGGASRTMYSCGVMDALLEEDIMADYVMGVSAGIAYGVSYVSRQKERNLRIMKKYMTDKRYMGMSHLFHKENKCFYNVPFVFETIPNELDPFDFEAFRNYKGKVVACVTNIHTGQAEYLEVPRDDRSFKVLVASCSLPILFQPVKIGHHYYLDGGVSDSIPFMQGIKEGCDKNIVVLTRPRSYTKKTDASVKIAAKLYRKYPNLVEAMETRAQRYNEEVEQLREAQERGEVYVIAPRTTFGVKRTEKDPEILNKLYRAGYRQTKAEMEQLKAYLRS